MQRILKSIQRDSKNLFRQRKERDIFSVDMILQKDGMFPIIRRQKKDPVLRVVYLYKKSSVLRRPHQVDIGEFMIQSPSGGSQQMGGMKTGTERGADRKIRVSFVLFRLVDIRRPALFLSEFFHPLQSKGIEISHRKVRHEPQVLADGETRVHSDHIGILPFFHEFRRKIPVRRSTRYDQAGICHFSFI